MNTARVSVELVLAGILGLCVFVLPFFPGADLRSDLPQNEALIGVLGLAYLREKDWRLDWMNTLKSRIHTSRELTKPGLPATLGIVLQLGSSMP